MATALIILLGNRDIQIKKDNFENVIQKYSKYFIENQDDNNYMIIDKFNVNNTGIPFLDITKLIWDAFNYFKDIVEFRLWELTKAELGNKKIDKIIITTSKQEPANQQDSFYIAYALKKHLENKKYNVELELCGENPTDFEAMTIFYTDLFNKVSKKYEKVFISNTGGTPQMRTASHFAGIFRNFDYISISSTKKSATKTFQQQENLILKNIVNKMLDVYDYAGVIDLPIQNDEIKSLAKYAINRIYLNFKESKKEVEELKNSSIVFYKRLYDEMNKVFSIRELEKELFLSAKIKFHQKAYADYLWRLFTIHDNIFTPYIEEYFNAEIVFDVKSNHREWNNLINNDEHLKKYLAEKEIDKKPLVFHYPNKFVFYEIVKYAFKEEENTLLYSIHNILANLGSLRNAIAHDYGGFGLEELEQNISKKNIRKAIIKIYKGKSEKEINKIMKMRKIVLFNKVLSYYVDIDEGFGVYDDINEKILSLL